MTDSFTIRTSAFGIHPTRLALIEADLVDYMVAHPADKKHD